MIPAPGDIETLPEALARTLRTFTGPLAAAALLLLTASLIQRIGFVPGDPALTWADFASTLIGIAGEALVILIAGWSVIGGGRPAGFAALRMMPGERAAKVFAYAIVFYLWLLVLLLIFGTLAGALAAGKSAIVGALIVGAIYALVLVVMWLQLGFLFPDTLTSGESGVILAMALGISAGRRVFAALALPAVALTLPVVAMEALIWDEARILRQAAGMGAMTLLDWLAEIVFALLGMVETAAYMIAMTKLYRDLVPASRMTPDMWR